jgi:hypothetical protein
MALSAEELLEIKKALDTPGAIKDEGYRTWALEQVQAAEDQNLQGWAGAGGTRADSAPVATGKGGAPGSLGIQGIIGQEQAPDPAEALAGQLDPRFDLMPQVLAIQPATTHPGGDKAAEAEMQQSGRGDAAYAYEPPVSVVQKQLVENPAFLRMLRPSQPPTLDEIGAMNASSPLYQEAANYMWRKTAEEAAKSGRKVYRYSQLPWLWGDRPEARGGAATGEPAPEGVLGRLALSLGGAGKSLVDAKNAFVMGVDDTAALGVSRNLQETLQPQRSTAAPGGDEDVMGVSESVPQDTKDVNRWTAEQNPVSYGAGQVLGMLAPWGAAARLFEDVAKGGRFIVNAIAKTRLGALAAAPAAVKVAGRAAGEAAVGGVSAGLEEAGQQGSDLAAATLQTGQLPSTDRLAEAAESVRDVGSSGAAWAAGGSLLQQGARAGADYIRDADRFDGKVRRAEPNLDTGATTPLTGLRLGGDAKALQKQARREGLKAPTDIIADEIAPAIRDKASENVRRAEGRAEAARRNYYQTPEGSARAPMTHLQQQSLEELRRRHQPTDKGLHAIDDKAKPAQKVFNSLIDEVSLSPIDGATQLTPDEASSFLGARARHQLLKSDIEAAVERQAKQHFDRKAYLQTLDPKKRAAVDEEIQASIDDLLQQKREGDRALDIDQRSAAYKEVEQQVLRERYGEEVVLEPFGGSFGEYLKQRGIDAVYVKPQAYDPKRTDALIEGLGEGKLAEAAKLDRQRHTSGGKKGGYASDLEKQDADIAKAKATEKRVAPGGDAFQPVASLGESRRGEKQLLDDTRALADQAGVRNQLDRLRGHQDTQEIVNRSRFRGRSGQNRQYMNWQNIQDAGMLRSLPILKALEGPLGPLRGGGAALVGQDSPAPPGEPSARSRYEAARAKRLKELAAERDEEKAKRDKRRARRAGGR